MRKIFIIIIGAIQLMVLGCIKTNTPPGTSSLNIINAVPTSNLLITNFQGNGNSKITDTLTYYNSALSIGYGGFVDIGSYSGMTHLSLSQTSDTFSSISNLTLNLKIGNIYSLFLTGTDTLHVDTLFTKDIIPYYPAVDSVTGVRFVNLSTGSMPVLVTNQADTTHTPITGNISYKTVTAFQQLSANTMAQANGGYTFEFRDVASNTILTTVYCPIVPFKNVTVCLIGQPGVFAVVPQSGILYNNY